jgi:hypothetical protein
MDGVQIVDLNAAFTNIINPAKGTLYISAQLHILASSIIAS